MRKQYRFLFAALTMVLLIPIGARAQMPTTISGTAIAGVQSSNLNGGGLPMGTYLALRGSMGSYFAEYRMAHWGGLSSATDASIDETGFLAGYKLSIFGLDLSAAAGLGNTTYRAPSTTGIASVPTTYQSLAYEAQAVYNFPIVPHFINAGVGLNAVGETSSQQPVFGVGAIATLTIGF